MITGLQIRAARISLGWTPSRLAERAKVPASVVQRAESSPGEPAVTIAQLNALVQALGSAGANLAFRPGDSDGQS